MIKLLGILGGMGPSASAEFLKTIYEYGISDLEQRSPACSLYSDPTSKIVIVCITSHRRT